jgi:hypothetical protein
MPLRDFFHPPLSNDLDWESVHHVWATTIVRALNDKLLPPRYRAQPEIQIGRNIEVDIATFEREQSGNGQGGAVATKARAPAEATRALAVTFPADDLFEVRVVDRQRARRLVAAIELVSPSNEDRPESRRTFAAKCASYLQARVSVVIVDTVTERRQDLYEELLLLLGREREGPGLAIHRSMRRRCGRRKQRDSGASRSGNHPWRLGEKCRPCRCGSPTTSPCRWSGRRPTKRLAAGFAWTEKAKARPNRSALWIWCMTGHCELIGLRPHGIGMVGGLRWGKVSSRR